MARLAFNKSALHQQDAVLKTYQRFLPPLDMKRRQLMAEKNQAAHRLAHVEAELEKLLANVGPRLPMLADESMDLKDLVTIAHLEVGTENLLATPLPVLRRLEVQRRQYSFLAKPHWVDQVAAELEQAVKLSVERQLAQSRLTQLEQAVRKITQRVNLFEKVLIPRTEENIRRIQIYLADAERAAVVRAKLAKERAVQRESL
ncbi:MAG: V-type ATP synthase subunit D [Pseudomonadota bacterium]|nr:V-type ATP synthase subunit D [Pseudomonadota bacterium]